MRGRVVLVAELDQHWAGLARYLEHEDFEIDLLPLHARPADVTACANRGDAVVVVDVAQDPSRGITIASACRSAAVAPVVVVANNPTPEMTRRVRLAGVFYLALGPLEPDEMLTILDSAFMSMGHHREAAGSTCHAKRRILIVDDDPDFVASTKALLEACGYGVSAAANGRAGLALARAEHPDLIVLDVMMEHDSSGYELTQAVKFAADGDDLRHIPILMASSIDTSPDVRFSTSTDVPMITPDAYMTKPLDIGRFLAEVATLLGERQGQPVGVAGR